LPWVAANEETRGPPTDKATWGPHTKTGLAAVGEGYAAMNIVPKNLMLVGDGAHRPTMSSKPSERR
jgi:hypothetical protein